MPTQQDPKEIAEKGVALFYLSEKGGETTGTNLFKKRILYAGRFVHPNDPGKWLTITAEHFKKAIENFRNGAMDRVNFYYTHNEDPRNIAGEVVGLEEGIDGSDGKPSLYAILKTKDKAATELVEKNTAGVSAGIDHFYREHLGGKELGMVIKHVALVGEGWIKQLGDFIPVPSMQRAVANLSDHEGGVIYFADEPQEKEKDKEKTEEQKQEEAHLGDDDQCGVELLFKELTTAGRKKLKNSDYAYVEPNCPEDDLSCKHFPINDEAHVRNALARLSQSKWGPKARAKVIAAAKRFGIKVNLKEGDSMPTKDEYIAQGKEFGLVALEESVHKTLMTKASERDRIQKHFKDTLHFAESDDVAQRIIDEINSRDNRVKEIEGERAFAALLAEQKVLPAQKDSLVKLYMKDKDLFTSFTKELKKGANGVALGEKGSNEGTESGADDLNDPKKVEAAVKDGLLAAHKAGIALSDENLELIGVKKS